MYPPLPPPLLLLLLVALLYTQPTLSMPLQPAAVPPKVVLISIDGMRADYLQNANGWGLKIPTLQSLMKSGASARGAFSVLPAQTFPAHSSMITGQNPNVHTIHWNCEDEWRHYDIPPESQCTNHYFYVDIKAKTVVDLAIQTNRTTAGVDWPVTVGMPAVALYPGNVDSPNGLTEAGWVHSALVSDTVKKLFPDAPSMFSVTDNHRGDVARAIISDYRPDLFLLHYNDLDEHQHATGWNSTSSRAHLELIDADLGQLIATMKRAGVYENTVIIVTSDHGFVNVTETILPQVVLRGAGLIGSVVNLYDGSTGGIFPVYLAKNASEAGIKLLDETLHYMQTAPEFQVRTIYTAEELEQMGGLGGAYAGVEFNMGVVWDTDDDLPSPFVNPPRIKGQHGYPPQRPEMLASFVMSGPCVKPNYVVDRVSLVDIGPTIAHVMKLPMFPSATAGRVLLDLLQC